MGRVTARGQYRDWRTKAKSCETQTEAKVISDGLIVVCRVTSSSASTRKSRCKPEWPCIHTPAEALADSEPEISTQLTTHPFTTSVSQLLNARAGGTSTAGR